MSEAQRGLMTSKLRQRDRSHAWLLLKEYRLPSSGRALRGGEGDLARVTIGQDEAASALNKRNPAWPLPYITQVASRAAIGISQSWSHERVVWHGGTFDD